MNSEEKCCERCTRILGEYSNSKIMLEEENEFLQLFLEELREEISNLVAGLKGETETRRNLANRINTLEKEQRAADVTRDVLARSWRSTATDEGYGSKSNTDVKTDSSASTSDSPSTASPVQTHQRQTTRPRNNNNNNTNNNHNNNRHSYEDQGFWDTGFSDESVPTYSDDDPVSPVYPVSPVSPSHVNDNFELISDSMNNMSKIAYKIKTVRAAEKIKSKNHPLSCLEREITTFKPPVLPSLTTDAKTQPRAETSSCTKHSFPFSRVLGRRSTNEKAGNESRDRRVNNNNNGRHGDEDNFYSTLPSHYETYFVGSSDEETGNHSSPQSSPRTSSLSRTAEDGVALFLNQKSKKKKFLFFGKKRET